MSRTVNNTAYAVRTDLLTSQDNLDVITIEDGVLVTINGSLKYLNDGEIKEVIRPYKVYTALLSQDGEGAPTAIVLENTLGDVSFSYTDIGSYTVISKGLFVEDKSTILIGGPTFDGGEGYFIYGFDGEDYAFINHMNPSGKNYDNMLLNTFFEVRVYN